MIKICAMSDLHGYLPEINPCELVLICGDIVPLSAQGSSRYTSRWYERAFKTWAESLPCNKVIFIAGNHELHFPNHYEYYKKMFPNNSKVTYLCHEEYIYKGPDGKEYSIFGTPYCKEFGNWAFMLPDPELEERYSEIPENLDILITHDQPYGYGDVLLQKDCPWANGKHIGNKMLMEAIAKKKPRYQLNGHLHSCNHNIIDIDGTIHYNVSLKDESYQPVYEPLYLEIDK